MGMRCFRPLMLCTFFALVSSFSAADDINLTEDFAGTVLHDLDPHCGGSCVDTDLVIVSTDGNIGTVNASINIATGNLEVTSNANLSGTEIVSISDGVAAFDVSVHVVSVNDTPVAKDDHYDEFPALEIDEDSDEIVFNVIANDESGDSPTAVVSVGKTIVTEDEIQRVAQEGF